MYPVIFAHARMSGWDLTLPVPSSISGCANGTLVHATRPFALAHARTVSHLERRVISDTLADELVHLRSRHKVIAVDVDLVEDLLSLALEERLGRGDRVRVHRLTGRSTRTHFFCLSLRLSARREMGERITTDATRSSSFVARVVVVVVHSGKMPLRSFASVKPLLCARGIFALLGSVAMTLAARTVGGLSARAWRMFAARVTPEV